MDEIASVRYLFPQVCFSAELLVVGEGAAVAVEICLKFSQAWMVVEVDPKCPNLFRSGAGAAAGAGVGVDNLLKGEGPSLAVKLVLIILPSSLEETAIPGSHTVAAGAAHKGVAVAEEVEQQKQSNLKDLIPKQFFVNEE